MKISSNTTTKKWHWRNCILPIILLLAQTSVYAQLSGSYTINPSSSASKTNYQNFTSAVGDMISATRTDGGKANGKGISGAVTFTVSAGTYTEKISIASISGLSGSNTVTFTSASTDSTKVILRDTANTVAPKSNNYVLQLDGVTGVSFKKITIMRYSKGSYGRVLDVRNGAWGNSFLGCRFIAVSGGYDDVVYTLQDSFNLFQGNYVANGSNGFSLNGTAKAPAKYGFLYGNTIDSFDSKGIYVNYNNSCFINKNLIRGGSTQLNAGIDINNCTGAISITTNKVFGIMGVGISRRSCTASSKSYGMVANNFVSLQGVANNSTYAIPGGIYDSACSYQYVVFNNVSFTGSSSSVQSADYVASDNNSDIYVYDNVFVNLKYKLAHCIYMSSTSSITDCNYNDLYAAAYTGYYAGKYLASLSNWQGTGFDKNSLSEDPKYSFTNDLHVGDNNLKTAGTPISGISTDIDGDTRNKKTPTIGADEIAGFKLDASVESIDNPIYTACEGKYAVKATIKNAGKDTITSLIINWYIDGSKQTQYKWTGKLKPDSFLYPTLGSYTFTTSNYEIDVVILSVNGIGKDNYAANDSFTMGLKLSAGPKAYVGPAATSCSGASVTLGGTSTKGSSYSWKSNPSGYSASTSSVTVAPKVTTMYYLTETNGAGCSKTDSVKVTVVAGPSVVVGKSQGICQGAKAVSLGASATKKMSYSWISSPLGFTSSSSSISVSPTSTTVYYLTVTDSTTGCSATDTARITVYPIPAAYLGLSSDSVCLGSAIILGTKAVSGNTYTWSSKPTGLSATASSVSVSPKVATTYYLSETSAFGCKNNDSMKVYIRPVPTVSAGTSTTACPGSAIKIGGAAAVSGQAYSWTSKPVGFTSSLAQSTITPKATAWYYLVVTNHSGCTAKDSIKITSDFGPTASAGSPSTVCGGTQVNIGGTAVSGNTYKWTSNPTGYSNSTLSASVTPLVTTTYILTETNGAGCKHLDSVKITVNPLPGNNAGADRNVCKGGSSTIGGANTKGNTYAWRKTTDAPNNYFSNTSNPTVYPTGTETYVLIEKTSAGCTSTDSVTVNVVSPVKVSITGSTASCAKGAAVYHSGAVNKSYTYTWQANNGKVIGTKNVDSAIIQWGSTTGYAVLEISNNGCSSKDSVAISINVSPTAAFGNSGACLGSSTAFTNSSINGATYKYDFGDGSTSTNANTTHTYAKSGSFITKLVVTSSAGCKDSTTKNVVVFPIPVAHFSASVKGLNSVLKANDTTLPTYAWDYGDGNTDNSGYNKSHTYTKGGSYHIKLNVTSADGCTQTFDSLLKVKSTGIASNTVSNGFEFNIYPNPFTDATTISYTLAQAVQLKLGVYDITGREIAILKEGQAGAGAYKAEFSQQAYPLKAGVYIVTLQLDGNAVSRQLLKLQ